MAVTGNRGAGAFTGIALVGDGARIAVIAVGDVLFEVATSGSVAGVIGAGVIVVADDGIPDADARLAVVCGGAGVAVLAFALVEEIIGAPLCSVA